MATPRSAVHNVASYANLLRRAHVVIRQTHPRSSKEPQREHDARALCWLAAYPTTHYTPWNDAHWQFTNPGHILSTADLHKGHTFDTVAFPELTAIRDYLVM